MDKKSILDSIKVLTQYVVNLGKEEVKLEVEEAPVITAEEVKAAPVEDLTAPDEAVNFVTMEDFTKAIEEVKALFSAQYEKFSAEKKELEDKQEELKVELSKKPDAAKINHAPAEVKEVKLSTKADRILFALKNRKNG